MNEKLDLARYRLTVSEEKLDSAKVLLENKKYKDSVSRSYYAMFTAARALLATKGLDSPKHSGVVSLFNQYFVKENAIDKSFGRILVEAKDAREESDYGDFIVVSPEEAELQFKNAELFVNEIKRIIVRFPWFFLPPNSEIPLW